MHISGDTTFAAPSSNNYCDKTSNNKCTTTTTLRHASRRRQLALCVCVVAALSTLAAAGAHTPVSQVAHQNTAASRLLARRQADTTPAAADDAATTTTTTEAPPSTTQSEQTTTTSTAAPARSQKPKIPPVNFTHVDALFSATFDDEQVLAKWRHMDKQITDGVRSILKIVFPQIVNMASDAKVSGNCSGAILKWILNLRNLRSWAVKMLDAIGKPSAGILEGSLTMFGNYRECLSVRAPDEDDIELYDEFREYFRGQYCVLELKPYLPKRAPFYSLNSTVASLMRNTYKYYEKSVYDELAELAMAFNFVNVRADLCVPSLCSRDDLQRVADFLANKADMRARVLRCEVEPQHASEYVEDTHLLWAMLFVIVFLLVLLSTAGTCFYASRKSASGKSRAQSLLTSMSLYRSLAHIKHVHMDSINDSKPVFLYALRLLVVLWVMLVSLVQMLEFQFLRELLSLRALIMHWPMQLLVNSSLQYDALILLTAFTYSYTNINSNLRDLVKYNLAKYSRLMPSIMVLVALMVITPLLYAYQAPAWRDFVDGPAQVCKSNGLINLTFLQNLLSYEQMCLPWTWIFCVELQLCVLAIPLVYMMNKHFDASNGRFELISAPMLTLLALAALGCVINFQNTYANQLPAAWFLTYPDKHDRALYWSVHLTKTWTHLTTFAVGLFAGYLCRCKSIDTFSGRPYGRKCCANLIWFVSACTMLVLIFCTHKWSLSGVSHLEAPIASATYAALAPLAWSTAWALILFHLTVPNEKQQRPSVALALTNHASLVRLGRLSFLAYLLAPYVNMLVLAMQEVAIFSSPVMLAHTFVGNLVFTFALAALFSALVELPCRRLIKKLALGSKRKCTNLGVIARQLQVDQALPPPSHHTPQQQQQRQQTQHVLMQQQQPNNVTHNKQS